MNKLNSIIRDVQKLCSISYGLTNQTLVSKIANNYPEPKKTFIDLANSVYSLGFIKEAKIIKLAAYEDIYGLDIDLSDIDSNLTKIIENTSYALQSVLNKQQLLKKNFGNNPKTKSYIDMLSSIFSKLTEMSLSAKDAKKHNSIVQNKLQGAMELMTQSIQVNGKPYPIEYIDDPDSPGWQMGVVNVNGKTYKVDIDTNKEGSERFTIKSIGPSPSAAKKPDNTKKQKNITKPDDTNKQDPNIEKNKNIIQKHLENFKKNYENKTLKELQQFLRSYDNKSFFKNMLNNLIYNRNIPYQYKDYVITKQKNILQNLINEKQKMLNDHTSGSHEQNRNGFPESSTLKEKNEAIPIENKSVAFNLKKYLSKKS